MLTSYEQSIAAFQDFKCKAKNKQIKSYVEFIYNDYCTNQSENCFVSFSTDKPEILILFEKEIFKDRYYSLYNAKFQEMTVHQDTLTINCKDREGIKIQIKITPN